MSLFPRTEVDGISLPRMLIGTNWLLGWSHTSAAADDMIKRRYATRESVQPILDAYMTYGIDAIMAPFSKGQPLLDGISDFEQKSGKAITRITTPIINVEPTAAGRAEARKTIEEGAKLGAKLCLLHHSSVEQLVCKRTHSMDGLPDYLDMIRQAGMVPGLSAHMPELILFSDEQGYDVQTYIQLYNCMGFLMQVEVEYIHKVIWNAKKPVMTIKSMAAGRCSPFVGLTFSYSTIRPCDMVALGAFTADEVHEDVEIAMAALEHRAPDLEGRNSPNKTVVLGGK